MKVRFYSDTNFSEVKDALESFDSDAPVSVDDTHLEISFPARWYDTTDGFIDGITAQFGGDIYW